MTGVQWHAMRRWWFGTVCFVAGVVTTWWLLNDVSESRRRALAHAVQENRSRDSEHAPAESEDGPTFETEPPKRLLDLAHPTIVPVPAEARAERAGGRPAEDIVLSRGSDRARFGASSGPGELSGEAGDDEGEVPIGIDAPAATIHGKVVIKSGRLYARDLPKMRSDPACNALDDTRAPDDDVVIEGERRVANAFVWIVDPPPGDFEPPQTPARFEFRGCAIHPRAVPLQLGQKLEFVNADVTTHVVRVGDLLHFSLPKGSEIVKPAFFSRDLLTKFNDSIWVRCDVHRWEGAYVHLRSHPFFGISSKDGTFAIGGLPDGKYHLRATHGDTDSDPGEAIVVIGGIVKGDATIAFRAVDRNKSAGRAQIEVTPLTPARARRSASPRSEKR